MRMSTVTTIFIAAALLNSVLVLSTNASNGSIMSEARKPFPAFDSLKRHQKHLSIDESKRDLSAEGGFATGRRQRPISIESGQPPVIAQISALTRYRTAMRVEDMKTNQQAESGMPTESKRYPSRGHQVPVWSTSKADDSAGVGQRSQDSLPAESRQRPGQIPSWSNPPNVPWMDDPPSRDSLSLLPILYLLAPLVVTAMLMPIGATLITAIVMMKAHHQNAQGRLKSLFLDEDRVAPVYRVFEQNLQDFWQKFEEAVAKYNHGDMEHRRKS